MINEVQNEHLILIQDLRYKDAVDYVVILRRDVSLLKEDDVLSESYVAENIQQQNETIEEDQE